MDFNAKRPILIWDIDGTLIEARGVGRQALNDAFSHLYHVDNAFSDLHFGGATDYDLLRQAVEKTHPQPVPNPSAFFAEYLRCLRLALAASPIKPLPGVRDILGRLSQSGWPMVLGTGNIRAGAYCKLAAVGIANYFPHGGFSRPGLSRAEILQEARHPYNSRYPAIVIGDTPRDIDAAQAIGATALGVATGRFTAEELRTHGADCVLASLKDYPTFIAAIMDLRTLTAQPKIMAACPTPDGT